MQTTLRIDDATYRKSKAEAARCGMTITRFLEEALRQKIDSSRGEAHSPPDQRTEIEERHRLMEALLLRTAHFRAGKRPTREEMNDR